MVDEITRLDSPIDVMYLIHKAMLADTARAEAKLAQAVEGGDLQPFREAFDFWTKQLLYHAVTEDEYMTGPITDSQPARDNEAEHQELARQAGDIGEYAAKGDVGGFEQTVREAMFDVTERQHEELTERMEDVMEILKTEMGDAKVTARARRHLYRKVVELRITESDHLENEEAFVLPIVRERMDEQQQLDVAQRLLFDDSSAEPRWVLDWVASELTPKERGLLTDLAARFTTGAAT